MEQIFNYGYLGGAEVLEFIIKYWLEVAFTLIVGAFSFMTRKVITLHKKQKSVEAGVVALLRNAMLQEYRKYKTLGEIPIIDKENFEHMYKEYHALGGNDIGTQMYDEIKKLKTKIIDE